MFWEHDITTAGTMGPGQCRSAMQGHHLTSLMPTYVTFLIVPVHYDQSDSSSAL